MEFNQEAVDFICEKIANGDSLRKVLREHQAAQNLPGMSTIFKWLDAHESFAKQYARACDERVETFAEEIKDLSDEAVGKGAAGVNAKKLQIETRKWLMGKTKPKKYGDRVQVDNTHSFENVSDEDLIARRNMLLKNSGFTVPVTGETRKNTEA